MELITSAKEAKVTTALQVELSTKDLLVHITRGENSAMRLGIGADPIDAPAAIAIVHKLVKRAREEGFKTLILDFKQFEKLLARDAYWTGHLLAEALHASAYQFNRYKKAPEAGFPTIAAIYIQNTPAAGVRGIEEGEVVARYYEPRARLGERLRQRHDARALRGSNQPAHARE